MRRNSTLKRGLLATMLAVAVMGLALANPVAAGQGGTARPIEGTGTGTNIITFGLPTTIVVDEVADMSHLGATTIHLEGAVTPTVTGSVLSGTAIMVAANGDTLTLALSGTTTNTPTGAQGVVVGQIAGGTGRFESASGTITDNVVLTITSVTPTGVVAAVSSTFSGSISY